MATHDLSAVSSAGAALVSVTGKAYPLAAARIDARAEGGIASTVLVQTFENPYDEPLEVLYTLPLPADGAVLGYTIRMGERIIRGEVQPRERADAAYREALYEGRTAGLLEQTRPDTFQQRLGNVPARTPVEVSIDVLHPLAFLPGTSQDSLAAPVLGRRDGAEEAAAERAAMETPQWEYRFPSVVGVRYLGESGRVPDAAEMSPDRAPARELPTRFELSVTIADEGGVSAYSPSHAIAREAKAGGARVRFDRAERLDRDVVLRWAAGVDTVGARVVEGPGLPGDNGRYALVTLTPPVAESGHFRRDLTVLIDASGSMDGQPIELAKRVVGDLLRSLDPGDRFELLAFSTDVRRLTGGLRPAGERTLREALDRLGGLRAGGGTEMAGALREALEQQREDSQRQVVLVTDGYIGFESKAVAEVTQRANARVHVVGIGSAPNRALTQQVAAAGRGLELFAGDEATAHLVARHLCAGTARPVLTGVTLGGGAATGERPARLRDVCAGQPLVFALELSRAGGTLELNGDLPGGEAWRTQIDVPATGAATGLPTTTQPLGALHGRAVIAALELGLGARHSDSARESRIEAVAMRHRIVSRRTSLVGIAEEPAVDPRAPRRRERLAVAIPAGVSAEGVGLGAGPDALGVPVRMMAPRFIGMPPDPTALMPPAAARRSLGAPWFTTGIAKRSPKEMLRADDVRWLGHDTLSIEFEVPEDGWILPERTARLIVPAPGPKSAGIEVEIVRESSTAAGPHARGLRVKLVFRVPATVSRTPGLQWVLCWTPRRGRLGLRKGADVSVGLSVPAETGA